MVILTDSQTEDILAILVQLFTGESYRVADIEKAISYLNDDRVSCPFERLTMSQLANELIKVARGNEA
jgi:hypothetical protein